MKLLDAATVTTGTGDWTRGYDADSRGCGDVTVYLQECDPAVTADIVGDSDDLVAAQGCSYKVRPFGIVATLTRSTLMAKPDDETWLAQALRDAAEIPVSRGLLVRQGTGDVWLGSPDVQQVPAPTALTDKTAVRKAISDARALYFRRVFGLGDPILHVNPGNALEMRDAGVIQIDPVTGDDRTIWGDVVVISQGYYDIPGLTAVPSAFWTAPIEITLSEVKPEEVVQFVQGNKTMHQVTMLAQIDTPPCAMVRVGPAPTVAP